MAARRDGFIDFQVLSLLADLPHYIVTIETFRLLIYKSVDSS